jgi:hypothetical protein
MNNADKTLTAVVTDSQNCVYVGNVMRSGAPFTFKGLERHLAYSLTATPVQTDGVSAGIEDWEIGEEILGSAN